MEGSKATKALNNPSNHSNIKHHTTTTTETKHNVRSSVHFALDDETKDLNLKGKFRHSKKKTSKFDYEDRIKGPDTFFHAEVATECETYFRSQKVRARDKHTEHFAFIVDLDVYEYQKIVLHTFLNEILQSSFFRFAVLILVLINAILIGMQTDAGLVNRWATWFHIIDQVILSIFIFEILIKWVYDFRLFWKVLWNIMDFTIVLLIILAAVLPFLGNSKALVVIRVVRAFRSLRSVSFLSSLQIVTRTILRSGIDMGNILLVLIIFMLVMSVMGVILFDIDEVDNERFLSALDAWYLLFICVTQDGWNQALDEFRKPEEFFPIFAIYLIFGVSIGAFVFANLIVAVIVANLELSVREIRAEEKLIENPLEFEAQVLSDEVEIQPIYDLFSRNNTTLLSQRPLRIPNLRSFSTRRLEAYISLIVALEQNMLEAEIIHLDMEKIMAVMLSIILQLETYSQQKAAKDEKAKTRSQTRDKLMQLDGTIIPVIKSSHEVLTALPELAPVKQAEHLAFLQQLKNMKSASTIYEELDNSNEPFLKPKSSGI